MTGISNRLNNTLAELNDIKSVDFWQNTSLVVSADGSSELFAGSSRFKQVKLKLASAQLSGSLFVDDVQMLVQDADQDISFLFAIKMPSGGLVTLVVTDVNLQLNTQTITSVTIGQSSSVVNAVGLASPEWTIVRSLPLILDSQQNVNLVPAVNIEIQFEPSDPNEDFYFTIPALFPTHEYSVTNPAVGLLAAYMPNVFVQADLDVNHEDSDSHLDRPMLRFIDIATLGLGESYELAKKISYIDTSEGRLESNTATLSTLVDTSVAELSSLLWLAKFSGTQPITRFNFSSEVVNDAFILETSNLNSNDELRLTSYNELNPPIQDINAQTELLKWQIDTGYYGKNAGTTDSLIESAKLQLIDTQTVEVEYDYSSNPYQITLKTKWHETFGASGPEVIGTSSNIVLESIEKARPLATKVNHEFIA